MQSGGIDSAFVFAEELCDGCLASLLGKVQSRQARRVHVVRTGPGEQQLASDSERCYFSAMYCRTFLMSLLTFTCKVYIGIYANNPIQQMLFCLTIGKY